MKSAFVNRVKVSRLGRVGGWFSRGREKYIHNGYLIGCDGSRIHGQKITPSLLESLDNGPLTADCDDEYKQSYEALSSLLDSLSTDTVLGSFKPDKNLVHHLKILKWSKDFDYKNMMVKVITTESEIVVSFASPVPVPTDIESFEVSLPIKDGKENNFKVQLKILQDALQGNYKDSVTVSLLNSRTYGCFVKLEFGDKYVIFRR